MVRNKPLLMIHSLDPRARARAGPDCRLWRQFSCGRLRTTIKVVVNKVWLQRMQGSPTIPDEEEDYDA